MGRVAIEVDGSVVGDERHLSGPQERLAFAHLVSRASGSGVKRGSGQGGVA